MLAILVPIAHQFAIGERILDRCVGDFTPADWQVRDPVGHDARWIVGHLAMQRRRVVVLGGQQPPEVAWETAFQRGTSPGNVPTGTTPQELVAAFHGAHTLMTMRWADLTGADLDKPLGRTLPDGSDTVGGAVRFLAWHEAYHLGQLGLLRRLAGKPGIA